MLLRIKTIQQVGAFRDFKNGGSQAFADDKKIAVVFARNTRGKSTFASICRSIGENDGALVAERRSIPADSTKSQLVEINYRDLSGAEQQLKFSGGTWTQNDLKDHILVFDQDFINQNVISGAHITREHKTGFTDFVLGTAGVELTKKIETNKKQLKIRKNNLPTFRPQHVRYVASNEEVDIFVDLKVTKDKPALEKDKEVSEKRLNRLERIEEFKLISEPKYLMNSAESSTTALLKEFTTVLGTSYEGVSDESWKVLREHMESNCEGEDSVSWLKVGNNKIKGKQCPFCAQGLEGAEKLIKTYQSIFDKKFEAYETGVKQALRSFTTNQQMAIAESYINPINRFIEAAKQFNPFIAELEADLQKIEDQAKVVSELETTFKNTLAQWSEAALEIVSKKETSSYKSVSDTTDTKLLTEQATELAKAQNKVGTTASEILVHIQRSKKLIESKNADQIKSEIVILTKTLAEIDTMIARIDQNKECAAYVVKRSEISRQQELIENTTKQLESEQTEYLNKYFSKLDEWFKKLGSDKGFTIEMHTNNLGDRKVFSLALKYNGVKIPLDDISKVFSESDLRNLALSVFMSRVENLDDKEKMILVLDDPVVSFDDKRISATCRELKLLAPDFRQIIITSHYKSLIRELVECLMPAQYTEIVPAGGTSVIRVMDVADVTLSPHERDSERISAFIDGGDQDNLQNILRRFLEEHLHVVFQRQITVHGYQSDKLNELIDHLHELGLIGGNSKAKLHAFREDLNPENHKAIDDSNIDAVRLDADQLMNLVYGGMSD